MSWNLNRLRMADANLNRALEGLRTAEDLARFHLADAGLCGDIRDIRRNVGKLVGDAVPARFLVGGRDSVGDVGKEVSGKERGGAVDMARAAMRRAGEALRVLEETFRTFLPAAAAGIESMRYRVYEAEKRLLCALSRKAPLEKTRLYLVIGERNAPGRLEEVVRAAVRGGVDVVQYREKDLPDGKALENARRLRDVCREEGVPFIINDRVDLALAVGADGVHVGQEDMPPSEVRLLMGDGVIVGLSTHGPGDLEKAVSEPVDYVGVGPCFVTPTKPGRAAAGLEYVRFAASFGLPFPFFAIGGINEKNLRRVVESGAERVAVVRAVAEASDPETAARELLAGLAGAEGKDER